MGTLKYVWLKQLSIIDSVRAIQLGNMDGRNLENLGYEVILNLTRELCTFLGIYYVIVHVWLRF